MSQPTEPKIKYCDACRKELADTWIAVDPREMYVCRYCYKEMTGEDYDG